MMEQAGAEPFPARPLLSAGIEEFYTQEHLHKKDLSPQELFIQHLSFRTSEGHVCAQKCGII